MREKLLILTCFLLLPFTLSAAIPDMKFRRLDTRDGLSNSQVLCVHRDRKGFVWIGTAYGLNRYDGYRIKTFYSDLRDTTTLRSNYIDGIFEAYDGKLWLKQGMGYTIFDPQTEKCDRHPERLLEKWGVKGGLEYLYIDSKGDFWVKSYLEGFWHYRPKDKKNHQFKFGYDAQQVSSEFGVSGFTEFEKTVVMASNRGEIVFFDRDNDMIRKKDNYLVSNSGIQDQAFRPCYDSNGNLWIIVLGRTFICSKSGGWHNSFQDFLKANGFADIPEEVTIWDVNNDSRGRYLIATDHGGMYVLDFPTKEIKQFLYNKYDESSLSDNTLRNIYYDQLGRIWIGSYMNGLNLFTGNTSSFRNQELGVINTICYDKQGYSWLGTNDAGIIRYDNRTNEQVIFDKANSGIGSNVMVGSLAASDGSVWFGTYEGGLIHIKNGQVTNYKASNDTTGLVSNNIWTVHEDQWKNIWIGTLGGGVQRIDKRTGEIKTFRMSNTTLPSDYISSISRTKKGWLLVAHSKYVSLINPKTFRIINFDITDNKDGVPVTEMSTMAMEDSRGLIWQASTAGATVWDMKNNHVYLLDMRSGLFGSTVNSIVEDDNHAMWIVTEHGISNVIPQQQEDGRYSFIVRSYNNRDGLQNGPYNQRSFCKTPVGLILIGGQGGLDIFNPKNLGKGRMKEVPMFAGLQIADHVVEVGEEINGRVILEETLDECREVNLSYKDQFTIQLASSSGEIHNRSRFVYMLEGVNENWIRTSEVNPNITFMSLRYGDYTLRVRMLNDDGTIGEDEATLDIHIATPFWRARWAMLIYILGVLVAVWWWRRWFLRRQNERMALEQQRRELEKQQWMSEIRAQFMKEGVTLQQPEKPKQKEQLNYQPMMEEMVAFVKSTVSGFKMPEEKACKLSFNTSLNRLTMSFDAALIARLLDILISNSVKFSPRGARIKVNLEKVGDMAEIRVSDRGLGIPEEARTHMFDNDVDSGIGLDIVKRIVDFHGGNVHAEDNPDGGTIFVVQLPVDNNPTVEEIPVEDAVIVE